MKLKRLFSIFCAFICAIAFCFSLTGCPNKKGGTITLEVYSQLANYQGMQIGMMAAVLKDKFNVEINIIKDEEGIYETRMERGFLGDIVVWGSNGKEYKQAIKNGMLFDWESEDLVKNYGKYIYENLQPALEANREINGNGKIYGIGHNVAPSAEEHENTSYTWDIRWDLYNQLGRPEVKDLDDLYNLLVEMKKICPTDENGNPTYAFSLWPDWDGSMVMYVKAFATAYYGYDEHGIGLYDPETGEFYDALAENGPYITSLKFFNKLYRAGLVDPNSSSQTYEDMSQKLAAGGIFMSIFDYAGSMGYNSDDHIAQNKMMLPLVPKDARIMAYGMSVYGGNRIWTIGAHTRYPELCMEIINWLYTPEGTMYNLYGAQGLIWDYDENNNLYFTPFGKTCNNDPNTSLNGKTWTSPWTGKTYELGGSFNDGRLQINNTTWTKDAINPDSNGETFNSATWKSEQEPPKCDTEAAWREWSGCLSTVEYVNTKCNYAVMPGINYSESVRDDELELIWNTVTTKLKEGTWSILKYAKNDNEFNYLVNELRNNLKKLGYDRCVEWSRQEAQVKWQLQQELANK